MISVPLPPLNLGKKQRDALDFVQDRLPIHERMPHRQPFEDTWAECAAFYEGNQDAFPRATQALLDSAQGFNQDFQAPISENRLLPASQRAKAMIYGPQPDVFAVPGSEERNDRKAAFLAEKVWKDFCNRTGQKDKDLRAIFLAWLTGGAISRTCWDTEQGPRVTPPGGKQRRRGEVSIEIFSYWEFFIDPYARDLEGAQWAATVRLISFERAKAMFPHLAGYLQPIDFEVSGYGSPFAPHFAKPSMSQRDVGRGIYITDFWGRPDAENKDGIHCITLGHDSERVIVNPEALDNPYLDFDQDGDFQLPFDHFWWADAPHRFFRIGGCENLLSLQREINDTDTQIARNRRLHADLRMQAPEGSPLHARGIPSDPREIIAYNKEQGPAEALKMPEMGQYVPLHRMAMIDAMGVVGAQSEATQGIAPAEIRSAVGLAELSEKDETILGEIRNRFVEFKAKQARKFVRIAQENYDTPRLLKTVGVNRTVEVQRFLGADLKGVSDVMFVLDTALGAGKQARTQSMEKLLQLGVLNPIDPDHIRLIARTLQTGAVDELFADLTVFEKEAEDELDAMIDAQGKAGFTVIAKPTQNSQIHLRIKQRFMATREYRKLHPERQKAIADNVAMHQFWLQMAEAQAMAAAGAKSGAPGEKGQASQPKQPPSPGDITGAKQAGGMMQ